MVSTVPDQSGIQSLVHRAVKSRQLSRQEHPKLTSAMLSNPDMESTDRFHINRLLDYVRVGKVNLID